MMTTSPTAHRDGPQRPSTALHDPKRMALLLMHNSGLQMMKMRTSLSLRIKEGGLTSHTSHIMMAGEGEGEAEITNAYC